MSYTESDVIENIFNGIKSDLGISDVIRTLITWFEHQKAHYEVNDWDTKLLDEKIKFLKSKE